MPDRITIAEAVANLAFRAQPGDPRGAWGALLPWDSGGPLKDMLDACEPEAVTLPEVFGALQFLEDAARQLTHWREDAGARLRPLLSGRERFGDFLERSGEAAPATMAAAVKADFERWQDVFLQRYPAFNDAFERLRDALASGTVEATGIFRTVQSRMTAGGASQAPGTRINLPAVFWDDGTLMLDPANRVAPRHAFDRNPLDRHPLAGDFRTVFGEAFGEKPAWELVEDLRVSRAALDKAEFWRANGHGPKGSQRSQASAKAVHAWLADFLDREREPATMKQAVAALRPHYSVQSIKERFASAPPHLKRGRGQRRFAD